MKIFISYAHEDEFYKNELLKQLRHLERDGIISGWHDRLINPGEKWDESIQAALYECDVILFLISADFLASDYIYQTEIKIAFERHEKGEVSIIPVILRPCLWQDTELERFQALPIGAKSVSTWGNLDEGLFNIAQGISKIIKGEKPEEIDIIPEVTLPNELIQNLIIDDKELFKKLRRGFLGYKIPVEDKPSIIFQHYGWLIEVFLQKMNTSVGKKRDLRRLSFMAEAFHSSLRYLCYIQIAQVLMNQKNMKMPASVFNFFKLNKIELVDFDWSNFLIKDDLCNSIDNFMPEISHEIIPKLKKPESNLSGTVLFLNKNRQLLLNGEIDVNENFDQLLNEYLTALVFWLRNIAFLAKYRLASIKDINLKYRLGSEKHFVHNYGELHGWYSEISGEFSTYSIQDVFTYNRSVLLFKGRNIDQCLDQIKDNINYLSLSPLIIDQSVFSEKETQTPEIYYYTGKSNDRYHFAQYKNELELRNKNQNNSNKNMEVEMDNDQPKLNELFMHLEQVLQPVNMTHL